MQRQVAKREELTQKLTAAQAAEEAKMAQFRALLAASGFQLARVVPTKGMFSVVEAAPV